SPLERVAGADRHAGQGVLSSGTGDPGCRRASRQFVWHRACRERANRIYGVIMTLSRRAQVTLGVGGVAALGAGSAILLGGILGLAWWTWRRRPGREPVTRFRRTRIALVTAGVVIIAVGAIWRLTIAITPVAACTPPGGPQVSTRTGGFGPSLVAQKVATWPETGIGLLYSRVSDAKVCWS